MALSRPRHPPSWVAYTPGADEIELGLAAPPGSAAGDPRAVTVNTSWLRHNCAALLEESSGQKIGRSVLCVKRCPTFDTGTEFDDDWESVAGF